MEEHINTDLPFSIVPHWVTDSNISDRALRLYSVLAKFADSKTGQAFPGRTRLSRELNCSHKSVDRAVKELEGIGAIQKVQRVKDKHFQSSLYTVVRVNPATHKSRPRVMDDATPRQGSPDLVSPVTHITRTTELEPKELESQKSPKRQNKETRLPEDWTPSERLMEMFDTKWPHLEPAYEVEQFINYWLSVNTRKADWDRTFQVWMNKNEKDADKRGLVRGKRLTNNEQAALLAMKYREQHAQAEITSETDSARARQIETEATSWMKGIDDV